MHIYQSQAAFLHNRELSENNGVFVVRCRALTSLAPKTNLATQAPRPLNASTPEPSGGGFGGKGAPRDRLINTKVWIVKGDYKSYMGVIKDTNGHMARVELSTNNKVISIDKGKLRRKEYVYYLDPDCAPSIALKLLSPISQNGKMIELEASTSAFGSFGSMPPPGPYNANRQGPSSFAAPSAGRTPNPYLAAAGGRTPGAGMSGRTPNPYAGGGGGRTPGWAPTAPTPNPYATGSRTPGWNTSVTPNPYASMSASSSFATNNTYVNNGGQTPGYNSTSNNNNDAWGTSPNHASTTSNGWGSELASPAWVRVSSISKTSGWDSDIWLSRVVLLRLLVLARLLTLILALAGARLQLLDRHQCHSHLLLAQPTTPRRLQALVSPRPLDLVRPTHSESLKVVSTLLPVVCLYSNSHSIEDPDPFPHNWVKDFSLYAAHVIHDSKGHYDSGAHDEVEGVLASKCEVNSSGIASTVDVELLSGAVLRGIPIDRLRPKHPANGDYAVAITGTYPLTPLRVDNIDDDNVLSYLVNQGRDDSFVLNKLNETVKITWPTPPR